MNVRDFVWHRLLRRPYQLAASEAGDGEPLVLLHGLGASGEIWDPLLKRLDASDWHAVIPDLLGFGDSPRPEWSNYSVDDHARSVIATLNKMGVKKPAVIVGHSMGCLVAAHVATRYPGRVKRMVLYAPPLFADEPVFRKHARKRERYFAFFEYIAAHPEVAFLQHRWIWKMAKRMAGLDLNEEKWLPFERSLRNTIMEQRAYQEMVRLRVPTDVVHGRLDFVVIKTEVDKMLRANPNIQMHTITGTHGVSLIPVKYLAQLLEAQKEKQPRGRTA
ncbi:MAG TPA: alpha/beta hydrolase [Candidatus Saccharimonadales bacterium]|nr:alpha/beta hydrolase [Candidatus Saccharimonadales bacterium]